jgi:hypothetical protein
MTNQGLQNQQHHHIHIQMGIGQFPSNLNLQNPQSIAAVVAS